MIEEKNMVKNKMEEFKKAISNVLKKTGDEIVDNVLIVLFIAVVGFIIYFFIGKKKNKK